MEEVHRHAAANPERRLRSLTVARPWGWLWLPGIHQLIEQDPDLTDQRSARPISTAAVDWYLILHAVRHAIATLPHDPAELTSLDEVAVDSPVPLTKDEHALAQSWIGPHAPVTYWPEDQAITDGRHRLWLTRPHYTSCDVPVFDEHLAYLEDVRAGHIPASITAETIAGELSWWASQHQELQRPAHQHRRVLCALLTELT